MERQSVPRTTAEAHPMTVPRIRRLREERGMTIAQLAATAGIGASHLSQIERGRQGLSMTVAIRIGDALGVLPSELLASTSPIATDTDALVGALIAAGMRRDVAWTIRHRLSTHARREVLGVLTAILPENDARQEHPL